MATSAERIRAWRGPALLSYGFRPFFLGGAAWAALAMALWIGILSGHVSLPTSFDPVSWHAHELMFGYLGAIVAGFLLTAVPNWTGQLPIMGLTLGLLFALWVLGRFAIAFSDYLSPGIVLLVDLAMPVCLALAIAREILRGKNWRNLLVLVLLTIMIVGNGLFHWEAWSGTYAAQGLGLRIGLAAGILMIGVIGGRIIPSFTRNWLVKNDPAILPEPFSRFDRIALLVLLTALILWAIAPESYISGLALVFAGLVHAWRLARWRGYRTLQEPLVWSLHLGYGFLPLGACAIGLAILTPDFISAPAAQHLWMAGAIGLMTLAVMTRATLGHTGRALTAARSTSAINVLVIFAVLARLAGGFLPVLAHQTNILAGICWIAAFGGFVVLYGPLLLRQRQSS